MKKEDKRLLFRILNLSAVGFSMVLAIFIGLAIGVYIDKTFGTHPWATLICLIIGIIAGFNNLFYFTKKYGRETKDTDEK